MIDERRTEGVKPHNYQPSKADLEKDINIRRRYGSRPIPEKAARVAFLPVNGAEDLDA